MLLVVVPSTISLHFSKVGTILAAGRNSGRWKLRGPFKQGRFLTFVNDSIGGYKVIWAVLAVLVHPYLCRKVM